jgi:xylulokinase
LTLRHRRRHLTRAILEGVSYGLKDDVALIQNAGLGKFQQVRASGGGTRSALWLKILASVLEVELVTVNTTEGAAFGAALLAGVGAGAWADVPGACADVVRITSLTAPDPKLAEAYRLAYPLYGGLYPALKPGFDRLVG